MATAYTSLLGLALPVTGELSGTWGDIVNDTITSLLDTAVAGTTSLTTDADVTLTTTDGVANEARQAIILWNPASGTTTRNITAPAQSKIYTVINASGGTQSIVFRGAGPTTGVTIIKGESAVVAWNGSDFIKISNTGGGGSFTNVTISGTTTLSGLTASTALALNASKEVVSVTNTGTGNNVLSASPTLTGTISGANASLSGTLAVTGVATLTAQPILSSLTASQAVFTDGSKGLVSNAITGTGNVVMSASPTLTGTLSGANASLSGTLAVTGVATLGNGAVLGTPASVTLTNATGLPISTGVSGLGTGIATALAVNVGSAGAPVLFNGALGTPSSGTVTNLTGTASININGTVGATTPAAGTFTTVVADYVYASNIASVGSFTWNTATSSPAAVINRGSQVVTPIHTAMRRCVVNDSGVVQYYLSATDSTQKADGTSANIDGTDGQVMVEIPKFYARREVSGTYITWSISPIELPGFALHPAFLKDGVEVDFRYYGSYDACVYDDSAAAYISGLNWDNNISPNGVSVDTAADKLSSVSGIYPMVGLTRAEFRTLAANRGTGWRQVDFTLWSAAQLLYLIEYQSFYSQNILGAGNTNGSYLASSGSQSDSPHTVAGASNSLGNTSTNTTTGAGVSAKPGTSFMSYRGIENFYGNCWNWADGIIVNPDGTASGNAGDWWFTNNSADFSDSVRTNMTQITNGAATATGYVSAIASVDNFFVGTNTSGGSSATYITDQLFASTAADRVVLVGGAAAAGATAGAFCVAAADASSYRIRYFGGRLAR